MDADHSYPALPTPPAPQLPELPSRNDSPFDAARGGDGDLDSASPAPSRLTEPVIAPEPLSEASEGSVSQDAFAVDQDQDSYADDAVSALRSRLASITGVDNDGSQITQTSLGDTPAPLFMDEAHEFINTCDDADPNALAQLAASEDEVEHLDESFWEESDVEQRHDHEVSHEQELTRDSEVSRNAEAYPTLGRALKNAEVNEEAFYLEGGLRGGVQRWKELDRLVEKGGACEEDVLQHGELEEAIERASQTVLEDISESVHGDLVIAKYATQIEEACKEGSPPAVQTKTLSRENLAKLVGPLDVNRLEFVNNEGLIVQLADSSPSGIVAHIRDHGGHIVCNGSAASLAQDILLCCENGGSVGLTEPLSQEECKIHIENAFVSASTPDWAAQLERHLLACDNEGLERGIRSKDLARILTHPDHPSEVRNVLVDLMKSAHEIKKRKGRHSEVDNDTLAQHEFHGPLRFIIE